MRLAMGLGLNDLPAGFGGLDTEENLITEEGDDFLQEEGDGYFLLEEAA